MNILEDGALEKVLDTEKDNPDEKKHRKQYMR